VKFKPLEDMSIGQRIVFTVVLVIVLLLLLAAFGYLTGRWEEAAAAPAPISPYETRLIALDREAIDNAYRSKVEQLFGVWLKDETGQPGRAVVGVTQARKAYAGAMVEIERREQELYKLTSPPGPK
jgi:nitric oxide reductase large subunit